MILARWIRMEQTCRGSLRTAVAGFAQAQRARAAPAVLWAWAEEGRIACALVAPLKFAPGRTRRWAAWTLAPLVASYRLFGLRAYFEADAVYASGGRIASCESMCIGECAVVVSCFPPVHADFMAAFRNRIEAQQGWQFDNSWPSEEERAAISGALTLEASGAAS
jgi:hypothetical protein